MIKNNMILGAIVPNTDKKTLVNWYKKYLKREPTEEEYIKWKDAINRFKKDIDESGMPSLNWDEVRAEWDKTKK